MAAAIAKRGSPRIGRPVSRTNSPLDIKPENLPEPSSEKRDAKPLINGDGSQPFPGSRRPGQPETEDYFSTIHNTSHFSLEPNPFDQSFGCTSAETPGKSLLPPVAALTSPSLPGSSAAGTFPWGGSLRSGPLSPAMLTGPSGSSDFLETIGRGFPTPNESSLRTGLTPGGGGSMFPAPSPGSTSILQQLQSGGNTPSTLEFHRTAITAARKNGAPTSNPQDTELLQHAAGMDITKSGPPLDFTHPDATDAANGLYMLAKGGQADNGQFPQSGTTDGRNSFSRNTTPMNGGLGIIGGDMADPNLGDYSDGTVDQGRVNRNKSKRSAPKSTTSINGRRKAEETNKGSNKKVKSSNGTAADKSNDEDAKHDSDSGPSTSKKMTDDEKRKNFLERNRVAALKCRQRKKQWLANLQAKVEMFSQENENLSSTVTKLREEIVTLKSVLLAHKDCPVTQAQGLNATIMMNGLGNGDYLHPQPHPYAITMQPGVPGIPAQAMARR
ncbi:Transcription factor [Ophidiomyces ophidiicola]|nr:Transcription factor [Ophidiomyces ophidiicola]KAI1956031.1 Transcription factor [Ophidiomyces ophidiicola]KAI2018821.1 Transcription factor [Ophidiomyces ophidiicola]KAI2028256.1 Transcription factor [Ophidiomyces ophidiicola]KAI2034150.1 Transcription factor [Ophidiomyces ophidiicola]